MGCFLDQTFPLWSGKNPRYKNGIIATLCPSHQIVSLLRQRARPYLFSNSLPPPVVASASQVFSMLMDDSSFVSKIKDNTTRLKILRLWVRSKAFKNLKGQVDSNELLAC